jgi:hypothetical protein
MEKVNLNKKVYSKTQYPRVIDTSFSQLIKPVDQTSIDTPTISVDEFFTYYNQLFFDIPKFGETNSHEYLVRTSGEYINIDQTDATIQALLAEIDLLREENLQLNQDLIQSQSPSRQQIQELTNQYIQ